MTVRIVSILCFALLAASPYMAQAPQVNTGQFEGLYTGSEGGGGSWVCNGNIQTASSPPGCSTGWKPASAVTAGYAGKTLLEVRSTNLLLAEIKAKLDENTKAFTDNKLAMEKMATQMNEGIQQIIAKRFDTLVIELINDPAMKARLDRLKEEIIGDLKSTKNP